MVTSNGGSGRGYRTGAKRRDCGGGWALIIGAITTGCSLPEYSTDPGVDCAILSLNDQCDEPICPGDPQCEPSEGRPPTLPMNASCWVTASSNRGEIQGAWYGFADGIAMTVPDPFCPYRASARAMCLSGETITLDDAWGGGIGFDLNYPEGGDGPESKLPYDAASRGIIGFRLSVTGTVPQGLKVNFTMVPLPEDAQPFVALPGPGEHAVRFENARVPTTWDTPTAGMTVDPAAIYSVEVQAVGGAIASSFDYCVTSIEPIWQ